MSHHLYTADPVPGVTTAFRQFNRVNRGHSIWGGPAKTTAATVDLYRSRNNRHNRRAVKLAGATVVSVSSNGTLN